MILFVVWCLGFGICGNCFAQDGIDFTPRDKVLIVAPHPDDEIISLAGVIQKALAAGAGVKILYFTNGDYNEISFLFYKKQLALPPKGFVKIGKIRQKEAGSAAAFLGVGEDDLVFLGYPDRFTETILVNYWDRKKPCRSLLTRLNKVPYESSLSYGAPYIGQSILKDFHSVLAAFKPTKIFVSSPQDTNPDHRSAYVYLSVALLDLAKIFKSAPTVYLYPVHKVNWPSPCGYLPGDSLTPPSDLTDKGKSWIRSVLTDEEIDRKHKALLLYKSQLSFKKEYLLSFVRRNELFYLQPPLALSRTGTRYPLELYSRVISSIFLRRDTGFLYLKISFYKKIAPKVRVNIYLLGYRKNKDFGAMPKLFLRARNKKIIAYANRKAFRIPGAELVCRGNELFMKIPFWSLGNPEYIFSRIVLKRKIFSLYAAPWRILVI